MYNLNSTINKIFKFDYLHKKLNFQKFNNEEKELLKLICYKNHVLNFQYNYKKKINKRLYFRILKFYKFLLFLKDFKKHIFLIFKFFRKNKLANFKTDIIFFVSQSTKDHEDTISVVKKFSKKTILVDCNSDNLLGYKKFFQKCKIINIQDYFEFKDIYLSFIKTIKFYFKFIRFKKKKSHPLLNISVIFIFFLRVRIYKDILNKIQTNKIFIDRNNEEGNNYFVSLFKAKFKKNRVYSYSLNGLALNNDLISAHYLYSNIDYLFCYGDLDKIFIKKLFNQNKFKLLEIPKKIIPVGSARNFSFKKKYHRKQYLNKRVINFLYIKSNEFLYNKLDKICFEKFCYFVKKTYPESVILIKERNNSFSLKINNNLLNKKIISKKNIITSNKIKPEDIFSKADFIVGTTTASLAQAIYFDKSIICLDNKIIISSFMKYFCDIYCEQISKIKNIKFKLDHHKKNMKKNVIKNFIFRRTAINPSLKIFNQIKP